MKDILGDKYRVAKEATHETTDQTVDSQFTPLLASNADVLLVGATPNCAAQAIHSVQGLGWQRHDGRRLWRQHGDAVRPEAAGAPVVPHQNITSTK